MWTWNTGYIFAYIVAEYMSKTHVRNEVVIWDTILDSRKNAMIHRKAQPSKYSLRDHDYGLRGTNVTLRLRYSVMPHIGVLTYGMQGEDHFSLPEMYSGATTNY
jgi:signal peptidase complex subunit 3